MRISPPLIKGDPLRFRQVVTNLLGNAIKFTECGEVELSLTVREEAEDRINLYLKIRDTGIGIPKENLDKIFEAFQQADSSHTRKYGGTGLGLAICKKIALLMDGDVWAESPAPATNCDTRPGGPGSILHFTAWFGKAAGKKERNFNSVSLQDKRALVVDANPVNLDILTQILQSLGMQATALKNGRKVIPTLQAARDAGTPFHLIIADIHLPDKTGVELGNEIRGVADDFSRIPLIGLSNSTARDAQQVRNAGFDGFIGKPAQKEKLVRIINSVLSDRMDRADMESIPRGAMVTQYSVREDIKHSVRILLVEDNPVNQKLTQTILTKGGYKVDLAENGSEAVEKVTASPDRYDIIFMDIQMPEMDGMEATQRIRALGFHKIPIVAMTAHALKGDKEKCLATGMNDYITKPIKREFVFQLLEKWIFSKPA